MYTDDLFGDLDKQLSAINDAVKNNNEVEVGVDAVQVSYDMMKTLCNNPITKTTKIPIFFGMMVENVRTKARFYAAIPATKVVEKSVEGTWTSYQSMPKDQAVEYVTSEEFVNREENVYWKDVLEKWSIYNLKFHYYPDEYESEEDFFERYANPIIDRIHNNTDWCCYNTEFDDFDDYIDWDRIKEEGKRSAERAKAELERKRSHKRGPAFSMITVKIVESGETKTFKSKGELMEFLGCSKAAFARFLKGRSKLNDSFEILPEPD